jgi:hypothetical protein
MAGRGRPSRASVYERLDMLRGESSTSRSRTAGFLAKSIGHRISSCAEVRFVLLLPVAGVLKRDYICGMTSFSDSGGGEDASVVARAAGDPEANGKARGHVVTGVMAGVLGQLLLLGFAVLVSRGSGPWLLLWSGCAEFAGICIWVASRSNFPGRFASSFRVGSAVAAVPCVIGVLVLAWLFQLAHVL